MRGHLEVVLKRLGGQSKATLSEAWHCLFVEMLQEKPQDPKRKRSSCDHDVTMVQLKGALENWMGSSRDLTKLLSDLSEDWKAIPKASLVKKYLGLFKHLGQVCPSLLPPPTLLALAIEKLDRCNFSGKAQNKWASDMGGLIRCQASKMRRLEPMETRKSMYRFFTQEEVGECEVICKALGFTPLMPQGQQQQQQQQQPQLDQCHQQGPPQSVPTQGIASSSSSSPNVPTQGHASSSASSSQQMVCCTPKVSTTSNKKLQQSPDLMSSFGAMSDWLDTLQDMVKYEKNIEEKPQEMGLLEKVKARCHVQIAPTVGAQKQVAMEVRNEKKEKNEKNKKEKPKKETTKESQKGKVLKKLASKRTPLKMDIKNRKSRAWHQKHAEFLRLGFSEDEAKEAGRDAAAKVV